MLAMLMGIGEAEAKCREEVRGLGADSPPCDRVFEPGQGTPDCLLSHMQILPNWSTT